MTDLRKAAEMALEALEGNCTNPVADPEQAQKEDRAIQALRQALAQPKREWVGLTAPEVNECYDLNPARFASRIEVKLKEKNSGA